MLLKDDHEEKRRKSIKRERRKVREKGGKEAPMQMENIKMYEKTEKSEKTGKQKTLPEHYLGSKNSHFSPYFICYFKKSSYICTAVRKYNFHKLVR